MGIIIPSFFGFFNAHRALMAQQMSMNVINHNIANANTPGFSRQRVDLTAGEPYPPATISNYVQEGQVGQGVNVEGVTRSHDNFLDAQIRGQNSLLEYQKTIRDMLQQAEGILGTPNSNDVDAVITDFFSAAHSLSNRPDDQATRINFMRAAQNVLNTFLQQANQLQDLRTNITGDASVPGSIASSQVGVVVTDINTTLQQIVDLNNQILKVSAAGGQPNDLMDRRDLLLEDLSKTINISVDYKASNQLDVRLGNVVLVRGIKLEDTLSAVANPGAPPAPDNQPAIIELTTAGTDVTASITGGQLGGLLKVGGNDPSITTIRGLLEKFDTLFNEIATQVNALQATGRDYNGNIPAAANATIFSLAAGAGLSIFRYSVNANLLADPKLIAAAEDFAGTFQGVGDGRNALAMAQLSTQTWAALGNATFNEYFSNQVSRLGSDAKGATDTSDNLTSVVQQLEQRRQSLQGVNMEEEMTNLLRFQRGFEASAKVLSTLDKMMDTIINGII